MTDIQILFLIITFHAVLSFGDSYLVGRLRKRVEFLEKTIDRIKSEIIEDRKK